MSKTKAPDTRGKLESVKIPKKKVIKKSTPKKKTFKEFKEEIKEPSKLKFTPKKTKGQIFKETHGFSKSILRAMRRNGFYNSPSGFIAYKEVRREKKKLLKKQQQDRRALKRAQGSANRATKKKK
jgi:hypothetical protein